jgi:Glycosyltransferase 61
LATETPNLSEFRIRYLHELWVELVERGVADRIGFKDVGSSYDIPLEYAGFGDRFALPDDVTSMDTFDDGSYFVHNPHVFLVRDAVVRTQYGMVTVDDTAIKDSLLLFPWHRFPEFRTSGKRYWETSCHIWSDDPCVEVSDAYSAHAGIHEENYYHWVILFLCRINRTFLDAWEAELRSTPVLLLPYFPSEVHRDSAVAVADHYGLPILTISKPVAVRVARLVYGLPMRTSGLRAHPIIKETLDVLRNRFYRSGDYPERIYVSRRDTENRRIVNEEEVEALLEQRGYSIIRLKGKAFAEQVNLFAHAKKVIAPHGAGLTNIGFSDPGTSVLEIQMPSHLNWCYRRLAAALGMRYGFLYGCLLTDTERYVNLREYRVNLNALSRCLERQF